jgi:hypothetical protein
LFPETIRKASPDDAEAIASIYAQGIVLRLARGGVHRRHGRPDGEWKDVLVVERLLGHPAG